MQSGQLDVNFNYNSIWQVENEIQTVVNLIDFVNQQHLSLKYIVVICKHREWQA